MGSRSLYRRSSDVEQGGEDLPKDDNFKDHFNKSWAAGAFISYIQQPKAVEKPPHADEHLTKSARFRRSDRFSKHITKYINAVWETNSSTNLNYNAMDDEE